MAHSNSPVDLTTPPHDKHAPGDAHHDDHGHGGTGKYWVVFFLLCGLTSVSFITMHYLHDTPTIAWSIMMAVSCMKAMLVISFFMHLIWEANWKWVLTIPAAMMSVFLMFMLTPDVGCRVNSWAEESFHNAPIPEPAHGDEHHDGGHPAGTGDHPVDPAAGHPKAIGGGAPAHADDKKPEEHK